MKGTECLKDNRKLQLCCVGRLDLNAFTLQTKKKFKNVILGFVLPWQHLSIATGSPNWLPRVVCLLSVLLDTTVM